MTLDELCEQLVKKVKEIMEHSGFDSKRTKETIAALPALERLLDEVRQVCDSLPEFSHSSAASRHLANVKKLALSMINSCVFSGGVSQFALRHQPADVDMWSETLGNLSDYLEEFIKQPDDVLPPPADEDEDDRDSDIVFPDSMFFFSFLTKIFIDSFMHPFIYFLFLLFIVYLFYFLSFPVVPGGVAAPVEEDNVFEEVLEDDEVAEVVDVNAILQSEEDDVDDD